MNFKDVNSIIQEKKPKIITFDYESHVIFEQKNIQHEVSDAFLTKNDLKYIQDKSYLFAHWFDKQEISHLIKHDEINIGELFYDDFHRQLVPFLKKFLEIKKLFESYKNSTFFTSSLLFEIICSFTTSVIELKNSDSNTEIHNNSIKIPIKIGKFSYSIKLKYVYLQKLNKIFEKLFNLFLFKKNSYMKHGNTVLFTDFTTKKYRQIFKTLHKSTINLVKFDRIIPAVWDFESYSIINKSNCLVENYASLIDRPLKNSIESKILLLKNKTNLLWEQNIFFESFFTFDEKSFWKIIRPILIKQYEQKLFDAIQEIELTKKLFEKYSFDSILVWSESMINHLIAIKLAKKQNISVYFIQHGLYFESPEMITFYEFGRLVFPQYADKFLVWGNVLKEYVSELGFSEKNIKMIGSPLHDGLFQTKNISTSNQNEFVLLVTSSPPKNISQDLTVKVLNQYVESIKKVCEVISKSGKKLIIKMHPQPNEFDITDIAKKIDPKIIVIKAGDISPLIKSCELVITTDISTTILEAQILEKPVISIKIREHLGIPQIIKLNPCISTTKDNFETTFNRMLTDNNFKLDNIAQGSKFIKNYLSNIGCASETLLNFLENNSVEKK